MVLLYSLCCWMSAIFYNGATWLCNDFIYNGLQTWRGNSCRMVRRRNDIHYR